MINIKSMTEYLDIKEGIQYKNYNINITDGDCAIRDSKGKFITKVPTEDEAFEYIDSILEEDLDTDCYIDENGVMGDPGARYTLKELHDIFNKDRYNDPVMEYYDSFQDWWEDTKEYLSPCEE